MFKYRLSKLYFGEVFLPDMILGKSCYGFSEDVILIELKQGSLKLYKDIRNKKVYQVGQQKTDTLHKVYPLKNYYNAFGFKKKNDISNQREVYKTVKQYKKTKLI